MSPTLLRVIQLLLVIPKRREVIEERSKGEKGGKSWDLWLTQLML